MAMTIQKRFYKLLRNQYLLSSVGKEAFGGDGGS